MTILRGNAIRTKLGLAALMLMGCAESAPMPDAGHAAPDLGECVQLAATLTDAGPVAHVYALPNGYPCEGGTCQQGECVP